jgi:hypothetical protein
MIIGKNGSDFSLKSFNRLIFLMEMKCVVFEGGAAVLFVTARMAFFAAVMSSVSDARCCIICPTEPSLTEALYINTTLNSIYSLTFCTYPL